MKLTDTHAHLDYPDFAEQLPAALERAAAAGVHRVVAIGTDAESSRRAMALAEQYPMLWFVPGIHPTSVMEAVDADLAVIRELAQHPRAVAIGETGLDFFHAPFKTDEATRAVQSRWFRAQLELAVELGHNVVIHQRASWADTVAQLAPFRGKLRAVFHCFGGSHEQAMELIADGHLVSITGIVTFKNAAVLQDAVARIPADGFMVETDCPYLAPVPHRGERCEPAYVKLTAEKVAALRGESLATVAANTEATANAFFRFM